MFNKIAALLFFLLFFATSAYSAPRGTYPIRSLQIYYTLNAQGKKVTCASVKGVYQSGRIISRRWFEPANYPLRLLEQRLAQAKRRRNNQRTISRLTAQLNALRAKVHGDNQSCVNAKVTPAPIPSPSPTPIPSPQPTPLPTPTPTPMPTPLPPPSGDAVSMDVLDHAMTTDDVRTFLERAGWGFSIREQALQQVALSQGVVPFVEQFMQVRSEDAGTWEGTVDLLDGVSGQVRSPHTPRGQRAALFNLWTKTNNAYAEKLALFLLSTWTVAGDVIGDETFRFVFWDYYQKLRTAAYNQTDIPSLGVSLSRDPLMLIYLNNELNVKGNPNENFARELMELFTLGTVNLDGNPNYTETKPDGTGDIAVAAKALTGWKVRLNYSVPELTVSYESTRHENGPHFMFAGTGHQFLAENDEDLIRGIFAHHPNASVYYARELLMYYLTPNPPRELAEQFAVVLKEENFILRPALKRLFTSKAFFHPAYRDTLPKNAIEFAVEVVKLLRLEGGYNHGEIDRLFFAHVMPVNLSPSVFWFNTAAWTSPSLALDRANFVARLFGDAGAQSQISWNADFVIPQGQLSAQQILVQVANNLGINQIPVNAELQLESYMNRERQWDSSYLNRPYDNTNYEHRKRKGLGAYYVLFSMPEFVMK